MKLRCIDTTGLELIDGAIYQGYFIGDGFVAIAAEKKEMECFSSRFEELGEPRPDDCRCNCSTTLNPPCSYCESGGWCRDHGEMRHDCGCEWDERGEY